MSRGEATTEAAGYPDVSVRRREQLVDLLKELVAIPSPNPPGDARPIATFLAERLRGAAHRVDVLAPPSEPGASSVIAVLGDGRRPVVTLHAHIDTVPVADDEATRWNSDPFRPREADGRVYGKGSVDDKAPLAAMVLAFERAAERGVAGTLVLVGAADEEMGGTHGTRWLAESGHLPESDFIVVGEQTANRIALAHKGVLRARVTVTGRSVHATNPDRGVNAIVAMARIVSELDRYHATLRDRVHPLVGAPTCNVGVIHGGSTANAVPDKCDIQIDRRMVPGEDPEVVKRELEDIVMGVAVGDATVQVGEYLISNWFRSSLDTPLGTLFREAVDAVHGKPLRPIGYMPGSDAKHLVDLQRGDMVVFGPGSYEVAHAPDEYVDVGELVACFNVIDRFLEGAQQMRAGVP